MSGHFREVVSMLGLGWAEVIVIGIVALLFFGPKKIPQIGSTLGKTLRGFKEEVRGQSSEDEEV